MRIATIEIRVYFEDTDFSGVVYHANYLKYFERGRTEALRSTGLGHRDLFEDEDPRVFTVRSIDVSYNKPARMDDILRVETRLAELRGARMIFDQAIYVEEICLATAKVVVACMDPNGRPRRLPQAVMDRLNQYLADQTR